MHMKGDVVYVGLSGGVDSSVAALRLKNQGYQVVGVFIKVWQPDFLECDWEKERLDAMRIAAHLDIPFLTFDAAAEYKREVADYMVEEYRAGRTPNPDVMCNQHIKFGCFLRFALSNGASKIATGHYAEVREESGGYRLLRGTDTSKDQSYFLWTLTQEQLKYVLFPIGDTKKESVRKEAMNAGLPVFDKKDSQGICFLGHIDIKEFLSHFIETEEGAVLDQAGNIVGKHDGALFYTVGQRHGFSVTTIGKESTPHYVLSKDLAKNTITVSTEPPRAAPHDSLQLVKINRINKVWGEDLTAQVRYRQKPFLVRLLDSSEGKAAFSILDEGVESPSPGQSCVIYDGKECVGGGIIE